MSSGGSRGNPAKGGSNKSKPNKSDSKTDKTDLNPKTQIKPTAEQMQLAKIIDSHRSEDPELREKIKQVMEITRATEDEACMALHSREYDTAQAITLLTDGSGQNLSSEWEQAGKKKKPKVPAPKNEGGRGKDSTRDRSEKRDGRGDRLDKTDKRESDPNDSQNVNGGDMKRGERGERGARGAPRRGGRGRGGITRVENKENDEVNGARSGSFGGRIANGPGRGGRGTGGRGRGAVNRDGTRTFASRARGAREDDPGSSSIGMWMNSQAEAPAEKPPLKVGEWNGGFPPAEDWDNEEYTGSLQETKVFTPSVQNPTATPLLEQTNGVAPNHLNSVVAPGVEGKISTGGSGDVLVDDSTVNVAGGPSSIVPGQSIALSMLLPKPPNSSSASAANPGANILASLQSSYTCGAPVPVGNTQALPPRHKVQRPQGPVTKIPSSAVEMPVDSVTTLDVKFGGLDFDDSSSLSFGPMMHGGNSKPGPDIMYNSSATKIDSFSSTDKDSISSKTAPPQAPSPFQNQRNPQSSMAESGTTSGGVPISPNIDSIALQSQKNNNSPQSSYTNPPSGPSAFANYAKVVPGYTVAPGFAPVSIAPQGTVTYSNSAAGNSSPGVVTATSFTSNSPSNYHAMSNLGYGGNQPIVTAGPTQQISSQPMMAPVSQSPSSYAGSASQPQTGYANAAAPSSYGSAAGGQYSSYGSKMQSSLNSQNVSSGHPGSKDSTNDNANVPSSVSASSNLAQMGSMQQNSGIPPNTGLPPTSSANAKISSASNVGGGSNNAGAKIGIPPGMVMQPQYILNPQSGVPAFYQLQAPFYGFEENVQLVPRIPPHMPGYYDGSAANYGNPMSFTLEGGPGGPGVSGRNDGTSIPNYSGGTDGRFPRSDSSTASPVPSNLAGQNTQQPMYNPATMQGYYFVGNNAMMHPGHFQYGPPPTYLHPTSAIVTPTNPSGASHAATSNHQYQKKGGVSVYAQPFSYDGAQQQTDYGKNSYAGGPGQNSNSGKAASATSTGSSQSTDMNSSMYSKGPLNKMNSYDKPYVNAGGYNSIGGGSNPLNSPLSGAGMGGAQYGVYIQPVQPLPLPQDGTSASRQGAGQPPSNKQYGGPPYWTN